MSGPVEAAGGQEELRLNLQRIRERISDAGGDPARVVVLAVTKGVPVPRILDAVDAGLVDLGESYVQELVEKDDDLHAARERLAGAEPDDDRAPPGMVRWHFIGGLQRNKVRPAAPHVHLWQSVDRLSLSAEIAHRAPGAAVLIQVNVSGSEQQGGCPPARVAAVVEGSRDLGLEVRGLMAIGVQGSAAEVRAGFRVVRELADRLELPERSMGMSGDLEAAVAEGSTMVRVGTALFGPRGGAPSVGK